MAIAEPIHTPGSEAHADNPLGILDKMEVISACGCRVGVVDRVEGNSIKLTRNDSPDGHHHFLPLGWVDRVEDRVMLNRNASDVTNDWGTD